VRKSSKIYGSMLLGKSGMKIKNLNIRAAWKRMTGINEGMMILNILPLVMKELKKKRSNAKDEDDGGLESDDPSASKKPRVVWSVELHQQFVSAVNQLGLDSMICYYFFLFGFFFSRIVLMLYIMG